MKISTAQLWVHDQDEALAFYTQKLGMEVVSDVTLPEMGNFRWLTVAPPGQTEVAIVLMAIPGPPVMDADTADQVRELMSKGFAGTVFLTTDDVQADYRGAEVPRGRVHRGARAAPVRDRHRIPRPVRQQLPAHPAHRDRRARLSPGARADRPASDRIASARGQRARDVVCRAEPARLAAPLPAARAGRVRGRPHRRTPLDSPRRPARFGQNGDRTRDRPPAGPPGPRTRADRDDRGAVGGQAVVVRRSARHVPRARGSAARPHVPVDLPDRRSRRGAPRRGRGAPHSAARGDDRRGRSRRAGRGGGVHRRRPRALRARGLGGDRPVQARRGPRRRDGARRRSAPVARRTRPPRRAPRGGDRHARARRVPSPRVAVGLPRPCRHHRAAATFTSSA